MKGKTKTAAYAAGAIVLAVILIAAFWPNSASVEVTEIKRGPMTTAIQDRGQTRVLDRYVVASPVAGNLERISFRAGDAVRRGDIVARVLPASLSAVASGQTRAAIAEAEAAVRQAEAVAGRGRSRADLAERERNRIEALQRSGIASREQLDAARSDAESARRDLQAAQAAVAQANANLESARAAALPLTSGRTGVIELHAPVDSRVFALPERSARPVMPGETIMALGNPHEIEAVIDVLSEDAVKVKAGDRAELIEWGGDHPLPGVVKYVESSAFTKISALGIEEQRVHVIVSIPEPPAALGDAYRVQGRMIVWSSPNALQIPVGALTRFGDRWGAYVVDSGRARKRTIEIGHRSDQAAEILSGLREGDRVIIHPGDEIADGVRVKAR